MLTVPSVYLFVVLFTLAGSFNFRQQSRLIALKGPNVVIGALNNQLPSFFWVLIASKANTTPLRAICWMNSGKAFSPERCIMPKIGGFSGANVPRPGLAFNRLMRPSRPFFLPRLANL